MAEKKFEGSFEPPPPGAPHEVSSETVVRPSEQMLWEQRAAAVNRAEERGLPAPPMESQELKPFAPPKLTKEQMFAILGKNPEDVQLGEVPLYVEPPAPPQPQIVLTDGPIEGVIAIAPVTVPHDYESESEAYRTGKLAGEPAFDPPVAAPLPPLPPALPHQRAASDTDSPSRGIPKPIDDPGKKITGGFGFVGEAEYFPLTGQELLKLVQDMLKSLSERCEDDLRFSIAAVYPRVKATVTIDVSGYGQDNSMLIVKHLPPHEKTPKHVAAAHADEVCFVVVAGHTEMAEDGTSIAPPNAIRRDLGLGVPRKRAVQTPGGRQLVDIVDGE